jgi:hypothetical protein
MSSPAAQRALATWQAVDVALVPLIGRRAAAALHKRSLQLAGAAHPALGVVLEADAPPGDHSALCLMLSQLPDAAALAAEAALTEAFQVLVIGLIGLPLTQQLLPFLPWPASPAIGSLSPSLQSGPAAQDSPP